MGGTAGAGGRTGAAAGALCGFFSAGGGAGVLGGKLPVTFGLFNVILSIGFSLTFFVSFLLTGPSDGGIFG